MFPASIPAMGFVAADQPSVLINISLILGAFGARNIPRVFKALEVYGIQQGRQWGLATLNELRLFFKLKPYTNFSKSPAIRM